jgi:hypothetical protein
MKLQFFYENQRTRAPKKYLPTFLLDAVGIFLFRPPTAEAKFITKRSIVITNAQPACIAFAEASAEQGRQAGI